MRARPITHDDLRGLPGLRRTAAAAIVEAQPRTVLELLRLRDVGRKTAKELLRVGLVSDPEGVQSRSRFDFDPLP